MAATILCTGYYAVVGKTYPMKPPMQQVKCRHNTLPGIQGRSKLPRDIASKFLLSSFSRMPDQTPFPTYMEDVLLRLKKQLPCRDNEVSMLLSLFGEPQHYSYPSILIYGHRATGKTFVTQTVLQELKLPHAFVSMVECFTPRLLFQQILSQLSCLYPSLDEEFHCETLNDFIRIFRQLSTSNVLDQQTVYIVIDQAEVLREMDANLLPGFLRLQELVGGNITVIFLTEIVWEKFRPNTGCLEPILFYFPDYTKGLSAYTHVDLPYYSKFLLIAAYLASFNPARTDKRFFLKHHGKMKKITFLKKHEKTSNHLLGPKPFPLDRLLAIFYSIVDSRVASTANIFSQVSEMEICPLWKGYCLLFAKG
ncbi:ORC5 protein, partial [Polypterus senegalus]